MSGSRSGTRIMVQAPAKLNLFLEILARRSDGFHDIETVMTTIGVYDSLVFTSCPSPTLEVRCRWANGFPPRIRVAAADQQSFDTSTLPQGDSNLVHRTLDLLRREAGLDAGAIVRITKRIPTNAGLGGASADAAAALVAGNLGWQLRMSRRQLVGLAGRIGSDVAFFLYAPLAICRGRGEIVESAAAKMRIPIVVVRPPVGLATGDVYRRARVARSPKRFDAGALDYHGWNVSTAARFCFNRLQEPASKMTVWISRLKREFDRVDVVSHQMSGSGTSYFGLCRSWQHSSSVQNRLKAANVGHVFRAMSGGSVRASCVQPGWN
jgi:4-diphosphocytidyl-2-C-methyl-D-erythritol kinase